MLSWLLFFARFRDDKPKLEFMRDFIEKYNGIQKHFISEAIAVFNDRASLRVTDVSSVVFRDFALWYVYYFRGSTDLPPPIPKEKVISIHDTLRARDDASFGFVLTTAINIEKWGELL